MEKRSFVYELPQDIRPLKQEGANPATNTLAYWISFGNQEVLAARFQVLGDRLLYWLDGVFHNVPLAQVRKVTQTIYL